MRDFFSLCSGEVVLHCLPEGAMAVYPEAVYKKMRQSESDIERRAGESLVFRRSLRRFGALTSSEKITRQGRITIPLGFRDFTALNPGDNIVVVGVEIGVEVWNAERWHLELEKINKHLTEKGEFEMAADLNVGITEVENV
jgi:DNA-binding transcriptional regulator/RsmH inhibitor MraZ